jgi:hypothetical protein
MSCSLKAEISKIYFRRFAVVFSPRKKVQDERHREKEKEKVAETISAQTKEFQKHQ